MKNINQHISGVEESKFVKVACEYARRAEKQYRPFFTHFYNREWMRSLLEKYVHQEVGMFYSFYGGYEEAERQVLAISPYELSEEEYEIGVLDIQVNMGIGKPLSHRDYLGALLGVGIERHTIGDIILHSTGAYVFVEKSMIPYIRSELLSIGRYQKITIEEVERQQVCIEKPKVKLIETTVSALRMDAVSAVAFGLSRSTCTKLIEGDKARRNGMTIHVSDRLNEGDVITIRGYGKAKIKSIGGLTKKERMHITIAKYI